MSLKQTAIELLHLVLPPDVERFRTEHPVIAVAHTPLSVVAGVAVGGVIVGLPLTEVLICGIVAGAGMALFLAAVAWLFDAPMGPSLLGLWDEFGQPRPLRFRRPQQPVEPARTRGVAPSEHRGDHAGAATPRGPRPRRVVEDPPPRARR